MFTTSNYIRTVRGDERGIHCCDLEEEQQPIQCKSLQLSEPINDEKSRVQCRNRFLTKFLTSQLVKSLTLQEHLEIICGLCRYRNEISMSILMIVFKLLVCSLGEALCIDSSAESQFSDEDHDISKI
ncbi:Hypothetical predicted protein [Octopus vulgaris]|uniref:Uncharacterized protein n=1 Tax=Octopus vulgaris TaxID=6645 RepID=A0AA36F746_OCTVU|nr:Hypothetical predicted protein [Octopus vulgaris]